MVYTLSRIFIKKNETLVSKKHSIIMWGLVAYLILSFYNFRHISYDGFVLYLNNVYLLSGKNVISTINHTRSPYLAEFILGKVLGFGSLHLMNLGFGLATVAALVINKKMYTELGLDVRVKKWALFFLVTSPTFLAFAIEEFKIEMFLLVATNLCFLFLVRFLKNPKAINALAISFFSAVAVLIKISFIYIGLAIYLAALIKVWVSTRSILLFVKNFLLLTVLSSMMLFVWEVTFHTPIFTTFKPFYQYVVSSSLIRERNTKEGVSYKTESTNYSEQNALNSWDNFYYGNNLRHKYLQPIYYIIKGGIVKTRSLTDKANPGIPLYVGLFALMLMVLIRLPKKLWEGDARYIYSLTALFTSVFYVTVNEVYWYLFPFYPFYAIVSSHLWVKFNQDNTLKLVFNAVIIGIGITYITLSIIPTLSSLDPSSDIHKTRAYSALYERTAFMEKVGTFSKIGKALPREYYLMVPTTFVKNGDISIIGVYEDFLTETNDVETLHKGFKERNIHYLLAYTPPLEELSSQESRIAQSSRLIKKFLENCTTATPISGIYQINSFCKYTTL